MSSVRQETMATSDKSSSPHTILNRVEPGTDPTGEGTESEPSSSKPTLATKEGDVAKPTATTPNAINTTAEPSSTTTTPPPLTTNPPIETSAQGLPETTASANFTPEILEEKKTLATEAQPTQGNRAESEPNNDTVQRRVASERASLPRSNTEQSVTGGDMQRSKSEGEVDGAATAAPSVLSSSIDTSTMGIGSLDDTSHLQELLSSQEGNNQIVERSPGERYVRFSEKLGSGASKDVYRAYDTEEGIEVAWNVVHLAGVPKNERNRIVNEVRLLERLHHQNIISFHGSWINREQQQVNFVTEILSSGTLKSFINKVQVIRWKIAKRWAVQILKGLEYLHAQDPPVIHRDLKCENIFINGTSGDLRIGDLGLSTVNRNGKALSVLGTPEFMAPDMYEEGSYDEKVDIYAFGMCLLEIFTKEIPYKECNNPAQIYKKVTRGAPPDSLSRLKSTHAREFIELCLGYRSDGGKYVRPSATELLEHPFLVKRSMDDEEVEVDRPLQEQTIVETGTRSGGRSSTESRANNANTTTSASTTQSHNNAVSNSDGLPPTIRYNVRQNSLEEDEKDRFEEMPDSEVNNMKKVKVMMGRGAELKEDDVVYDVGMHNNKKHVAGDVNTSVEVGSISSFQNVHQNNETNGKKLHYLVAAAVIGENEQTNSYQQQQPYPDDILKLVITLPVEGQTQNVQFDFHLVEDDPIQVAKEMVAELEIPEEAVLEISETVSGLARVARTKKHKFNSAKAQQGPGLIRANSIIGSIPNAPSQPQQVGQTAVAQQQPQQHISQSMMQPTTQQQPMQEYMPPPQQQQLQQPAAQNIPQPIQQQSLPLQDQSVGVHGQQIIENTAIPSQIQRMQPQRARSGDSESHRQAQMPYVQGGMDMSSQIEASNHNRQLQQTQMNGEYHHQGHVVSETKQPRAPYGQSSIPPQNPSMTRSSSNPQNSHSQIPQQRTSQQNQLTLDPQPNGSGGNYPQVPQNQIQSQPVQYPTNRIQQPPGHVTQPGSAGQQATAASLQPPQHLPNQQLHGGSQGLGQGYTQLQPSIQRSPNVPQQQPQQQQQLVQQPVQQIQNISQQQRIQNVVQQQPQIQLQLNQQSSLQQQQQQQEQLQQTVSNQQHQIQQGRPPQLEHRLQQQAVTQQHSSLTQNQQQHHQVPPNQVPPQGQRLSTTANSMSLPIPQDTSATGEYVPVVHQNKDAPITANNRVRTTSSEIEQEDDSQGELMGVLEGLSIDTSGDDEPKDEVCAAKLRKLDEDFQNSLKRAKKVFVNRMDNLQRTLVQREAQHQKTLEQHQKDRTAFEKRLQQEEIEQNRRIELMQKEWDRQREEVRQTDKISQ